MKKNKKILSIYALSAAMILTACGVSTPNVEENASYNMDGMSFVDGIVGNKDFGRIQRADNESAIENLTSEFKDAGENEYVSKAQYQINSVDDKNSIRFVAAAKVDGAAEGITYGFHVSYKSGDTTKNFFAPVTNFYNSFIAGEETYTNDKSSSKTDRTKTVADFVGAKTTGYTHFIALTIYDIPEDYLNTTFTVTSSYKTSGGYYDSGDVRYTSYKKTSLLEGDDPFVLVNDNTSDIKAYSGTESMELKKDDVVTYYANGTSTPKTTKVVNAGTYSTINYFAGKVNYTSVTNVSLDSNDNKDKAYLKISGNYLRDTGTDELTVSDFLLGTCNLEVYKDSETDWRKFSLSDMNPEFVSLDSETFSISFDVTEALKVKNSSGEYYKMTLHFNGDVNVDGLSEKTIHLGNDNLYRIAYGKTYGGLESWANDLILLQYSTGNVSVDYSVTNANLDNDGMFTLSGTFTSNVDDMTADEVNPYFDMQRYGKNDGNWQLYTAQGSINSDGSEKSKSLDAKKSVNLEGKTWSWSFDVSSILSNDPNGEYYFHFGTESNNLSFNVSISRDYGTKGMFEVYSASGHTSDGDTWINGLLIVKFVEYDISKAYEWNGDSDASIGLDYASYKTSDTYNVKGTQEKDGTTSEEKIMKTTPNHDVTFVFNATQDINVKKIGIKMTWDTIYTEGEHELFKFSLDGGDYSSSVTADFSTDGGPSWETGYVCHGLDDQYTISKGIHTLTIHALNESYYSIVSAFLDIA